MADVCITEYTDPGCPWAYSAEPFRRRLSWLYGDRARVARPHGRARRVARRVRRARLHARAPVARLRAIARDHGMPIDTSVRPRMAATLPACRAVVAARLHAPERDAPAPAPPARAPLRRRAARRAGDDRGRRGATPASTRPTSSAGCAADDVEAALREDMVARARTR